MRDIDKTLVKRSQMREKKSVKRYFHDDNHINQIDIERRQRELNFERRQHS